MQEVKFNRKWDEHLEQCRESARRIDGEQIQHRFHTFTGCKKNEIVLQIDEWIRQRRGEYGQLLCFSRNLPSSTYLHGNDERKFRFLQRNSDFFKKTERGALRCFLQDGERNAAYFGKFKPRYSMYIGPSIRRDVKFEKYPDKPEKKVRRTGKTSYGCLSCTKTSNPERM